jgi:hypothetical protein
MNTTGAAPENGARLPDHSAYRAPVHLPGAMVVPGVT